MISDSDFREIIDNLHDEIMIYDNNYRLVYLNKASIRHYGIDPKDLIGKNFNELDETYWGNSTLPEVYKKKKMVARKQITNKGDDIVTISTPVFDKNGEIKYVGQNVNDGFIYDEYYNNEILKCSNDCTEEHFREGILNFNSEEMKKQLDIINRIKDIKSPCLILGETGTGKNYFANYIHEKSIFKEKPMVSINCACISSQLIESELFGYKKGAFTGADSRGKEGLVELADGGILFLDEISELPLEFQSKLLHFIQYKEFMPLGGNKKKKVDLKIIAASNKNLRIMVEQKAFREDLYFRLNTFEIKIPPLRERKIDLKKFIEYFLKKFNEKYSRNCQIDEEAMVPLINYSWPGNIRELEHFVEKAVVLSKDHKIKTSELPKKIFELNNISNDSSIKNGMCFKDMIESFEEKIIKKYYDKYKSSVKVSEKLGISQSTAYRLIKKYIIETR